MSSPSRPLEPTAATSTPHDRKASPCVTYCVDVCLLLTFPCEPMARAMASVRYSYAAVFIGVALLYGGGIACFGASVTVEHPIFDWPIVSAVLAAWLLNTLGTFISVVFVYFGWALAMSGPCENDNLNDNYHTRAQPVAPSAASDALVVVFVACQLLLRAVSACLRRELLQRSHASSNCKSCLGSWCYVLCLPSCAFAEAMQRAREVQDTRHDQGVDELPAYDAMA